ncbi:hypothetical protein M446_6877 [Methylobacterium sp. 4-46]|nr:hypothetical protein M446_6877 [Methylobacterium sp. 4-46]
MAGPLARQQDLDIIDRACVRRSLDALAVSLNVLESSRRLVPVLPYISPSGAIGSPAGTPGAGRG